MTDRRDWIPGVLLSLGAVMLFGVNRQRDMQLAAPLTSIPQVLGGWSGVAVPLSDAERKAAGVTDYLLRQYEGSEGTFQIYVGYYDHQTQGKSIHSPKNCLPGSGWEAVNQTQTQIETPLGPQRVNQYLLQNKAARALVLYWYQGRGRVAAGEYRVKWELLRDAAVRGRTEEALVRIVVFLNEELTEEEANQLAHRVASDLIPAVHQVLPA